jgi:hypothetical protein
MALNFNKIHGEAIKSEIDYYKFEDGKNKFRMVGYVLPRYVYWKNTPDTNKSIAIECLSFDREKEKFTNVTKDWFSHYFPEEKCSWSYLIQVIDPKDNKVKVLGLKKKLFQSIIDMAQEHLGDPTDLDEGWDVVVNRKKTGPLVYNVEYTLDQLSCKKRILSDEERALIKDLKLIDELFPRPTPEDQKAFIEKTWINIESKEDESENGTGDDDVPEELV